MTTEPKPEHKKADRKLIRFLLPANPTPEEIDQFVKGIQDAAASNTKSTKKEDTG